MTYVSRGRSMTEVVMAVTFVGFLTGFVAVLCIGNYYRAKRAMERQKQRRLARLSGNSGNGVVGMDSPSGSTASSGHSSEQQHLLNQGDGVKDPPGPRRRNMDEGLNDSKPRAQVTLV